MRLTSIKLSGFKSFADPTQFQLPGQLVGVVGPNGCGKSNIMDAVRWVLGESKASELRGESMQDVIFNGSGQRKPASRASVELVFSNEDGRAGGTWNQYAEIAVRRVLTRDGGSSYYINNQPVRRRDVQDVFLGTGLGPRAYAIIGQGTISRIIESRPEELRLFLEEAAGVSKYKERRRETENRLKDTRENLARVHDILRELDGQLERLARQAEVARQYQQLQDSGRTKLHQLWFLKHRDAAHEQDRVRGALAHTQTELEAHTAALRAQEAALDAVRQDHYGAGDALHAAQGRLAESQLAVSRLEERIRYVVEGRQKAQARTQDLAAQAQRWADRQAEALAEQEDLAEQLAWGDEQGEILAAQAQDLASALPQWEDAWRRAQQAVAQHQSQVQQVQQQIQWLAQEGKHRQDQRRQGQVRHERLVAERQALGQDETEALGQWQQQSQAALAEHHRTAEQAQRGETLTAQLDAQRQAAHTAWTQEQGQLAQLQARLDALQALQDKVQSQGRVGAWLTRQGLDHLPALWTRLHIDPAWTTALDAALRERLGALEVGRLDTLRAFDQDPPPGRLAFFTREALPVNPTPPVGLPSLHSRLQGDDPALGPVLAQWLDGVYTADTLDRALAHRDALGVGDCIMTRDGHAVGPHSLTFYAPDHEQAGLMARAQEIDNLGKAVRAQRLLCEDAQARQVRAQSAYAEALQAWTAARQAAQAAQSRLNQIQVQCSQAEQRAHSAGQRREHIQAELQEIEDALEAMSAQQAESDARFEALDEALAQAQQAHADAQDQTLHAERHLREHRDSLRNLERQVQEAQFGVRSLHARRAELQRHLQTAQEQAQAVAQQQADLAQEIEQFDEATVHAGLDEALAVRVAREGDLAQARQHHEGLTQQLRRLDEARMQTEQALAPLRERLSLLQLQAQAAELGGAQYKEQLDAAEVDWAALAQGVEAGGVRWQGLQADIDRIGREIQALGAVNLAALEELTAARDRQGFLGAQNQDLNEAIATLEGAIRTIDAETRERLMGTFNEVNAHFGRLFPSLFGGGQARLVMTGDEVLDAGVQVMAQPPGKKNSSIYLLSGGEKALTAIALVFAIFQLNPAPFCLLDEVDAPLDDANTERYARLVKAMSQGTQFLFISHNKIAMEMAEQLVGVTMQEQGVSRIVAVDMQAALGMAQE